MACGMKPNGHPRSAPPPNEPQTDGPQTGDEDSSRHGTRKGEVAGTGP